MSTLQIEERITVSSPPARVWKFVLDPARVAACLPGAKLDGSEGDTTFLGTMKVKVGPVVMEFKGKATLSEVNEAERRVTMTGTGNDKSGGGSAKMDMKSHILAKEDGTSEIVVIADVDLAGKLVRFGRGMMEGISKQLFKQFSERVRAALENEEEEKEEEEEEKPSPEEKEEKPPSENKPSLEEKPVAEEKPSPEEKPPSENKPAAEEKPASEEKPVAEEKPAVPEETPAPEEKPAPAGEPATYEEKPAPEENQATPEEKPVAPEEKPAAEAKPAVPEGPPAEPAKAESPEETDKPAISRPPPKSTAGPASKRQPASRRAALAPVDNAPLDAGSLMWSAIWAWIKGFFARIFGRKR